MADDDEMTDEMDDVEAEPNEGGDFDGDDEPGDLEDGDIEEDEDFSDGDDDGEFEGGDDESDGDGDDEAPAETPQRRTSTSEDEDDDDDLLTADDVEADLDTILKDRLVSAEEAAGEDDEDEEPEDRTDPGDRLQPKRADEQLCSNCFLLVRNSAPACPVGADDDCPIFA